MNIVKLAQILELKYNFKSTAATIQEVVRGVKNDLLVVYKNYISAKTAVANYSAIPFFAQQGEQHCVQIVEDMEDIVAKLDKLATNPAKLFKAINNVLGTIKELDAVIKEGTQSPERLDRQSQLNQYRHQVKKLEESLKRVSNMLFQKAKILQKFVPGQELAGEPTIPRRKPLSKGKLYAFMKSSVAIKFGLDNIDVMTRLLDDPELREMLTTVINAIDRGHAPADGPQIYGEVSKIISRMEQKQTNDPYFEAGEDEAHEMGRPKFVMPDKGKQKAQEQEAEEQARREQEDEARLQLLRQQRDQLHQDTVLDQDRDLHVRSEGVSKLLDKLLLKGIYENS